MRVATVPLSETAGALARHNHPKHLQRPACVNMPLADVSETLRGNLEAVVREIVQELSPASEVSSPPPGKCCNGRKTGRSQRLCDWIQSGRRVECKSAKQSWEHCGKRWRFVFGGMKQGYPTKLSDFFEGLLLALHTPCGRHNGSLRNSREGGCDTKQRLPEQTPWFKGAECWKQAGTQSIPAAIPKGSGVPGLPP